MAAIKKVKIRQVRIGNIRIGGGCPLVLIAGPCVIENEKSALRHARAIQKIAGRLGIPIIYKSSYDKANRSSIGSFRGVGLDKGLSILKHLKEETGLPVLTDVHSPEEAEESAAVADVLQVPAFLCRQTDLLLAAGKTGRAVNVKKGQFMAPWEMKNVAEKICSTGNKNILLTERGTSFGYNTLVNDFRAIPIMKSFGFPVVFDATHSVQAPGGLGKSSGGDRRFVPVLAQAGVVAGADGIFMEVHESPDRAPSDGPNMVPLKELEKLLERLLKLRKVVGSHGN
ncbi:MAG: 3-deoxy-8-phosphooctulonate synthase [Omnitrophica bacterium RIFCSPHIGHO2_02_FULL_51_18]|nr:MAG: 3-deoxy-8-phosphooctulonate synthase [Omnitrophica bacterium RIFCSPHIGHO2_02_FULL_51_18]